MADGTVSVPGTDSASMKDPTAPVVGGGFDSDLPSSSPQPGYGKDSSASLRSERTEDTRQTLADLAQLPLPSINTSAASLPKPPTEILVPNKFVLYENKRRFYIVCSDSAEARHRLLRIERTSGTALEVFEDNVIYNSRELDNMLKMLEGGNKASGGLQKSQPFFGIAGMLIQ